MLIAGIQKMTLLDYPDKIAALIFTQGCNFACGYCHNPEMIPKSRVLPYSPDLEPDAILEFLSRRVGLLDAVVISGGEPTIHEDLGEFMQKIKDVGFLIKLDTNGSNPEVVQDLLDKKLLDYIAMDIKQSYSKYKELAKNDIADNIKKSIEIVRNSGIPYEFRSTILPRYHSSQDIEDMGEMIKGSDKWFLQNFRPMKTLDRKLQNENSFSEKEMEDLGKVADPYAELVDIR